MVDQIGLVAVTSPTKAFDSEMISTAANEQKGDPASFDPPRSERVAQDAAAPPSVAGTLPEGDGAEGAVVDPALQETFDEAVEGRRGGEEEVGDQVLNKCRPSADDYLFCALYRKATGLDRRRPWPLMPCKARKLSRAWEGVKKLSREEAMVKYVDLAEAQKAEEEFDPISSAGFVVAVKKVEEGVVKQTAKTRAHYLQATEGDVRGIPAAVCWNGGARRLFRERRLLRSMPREAAALQYAELVDGLVLATEEERKIAMETSAAAFRDQHQNTGLRRLFALWCAHAAKTAKLPALFDESARKEEAFDTVPTDRKQRLLTLRMQITEGDVKGDAPSIFKPAARRNFSRRARVNGMDKDDAMEEYIKLVEQIEREVAAKIATATDGQIPQDKSREGSSTGGSPSKTT